MATGSAYIPTQRNNPKVVSSNATSKISQPLAIFQDHVILNTNQIQFIATLLDMIETSWYNETYKKTAFKCKGSPKIHVYSKELVKITLTGILTRGKYNINEEKYLLKKLRQKYKRYIRLTKVSQTKM